MLGGHSQWEVLWVVRKDGKSVIISKGFGNDLTSAIDLYVKAKQAGKKFATLRCKNVAFPPPTRYQKVTKIKRVKVRRGGKIFIKRVEETYDPMVIVNHRGLMWCPYCREFRKPRRQDGFRLEGIYVPRPGYYCLCGANTEMSMVQRFNPNPPRVAAQRRVSAPRGAKRRSTRKR